MVLGSDSLSNVSNSSFVDGKNVIGREDPTKNGQSDSPWILHTNDMVKKKDKE